MLGAFKQKGQFWRGNLHGHSTFSDGVRNVAEVCQHYREAGYDFVARQDVTKARLDLEKFENAWCRVVVTDAAGKRAWTNPLWLDAPAEDQSLSPQP